MRRVLARVLFGFLALGAILLSMGVAAPPHHMPAGTPLYHTLVLAAYRYGFLIEPLREVADLSPQMAALHKTLALMGIPMVDMLGMAEEAKTTTDGPVFKTSGLDPAQELVVAFALLIAFVPRLPRPALRAVANLTFARVVPPQWQRPLILAPPRR